MESKDFMFGELLQIVPELPPSIGGICDFSLLLARELKAKHGVLTRFLNGDPAWSGGSERMLPFVAESVKERSDAAMLEALERASSCKAVLLHYVGHGYAKRGCPFWLVQALERWKQRNRSQLIVLFHEVSGTGPIWTSGFWTASWQTALAKRLARLADSIRITTEISARRVRAMMPPGSTTPVRVLPVFSTLGEIAEPAPYHERSRQMIVFGSGGWRKDAYIRRVGALEDACRVMRIEEVIDIGVPTNMRPALSVPFVEAGVLSAEDASALMSKAAAGFFTYPVAHIAKSTIFAAYCAHGLAPVTFAGNNPVSLEGLRPTEHFLAGISPASSCESKLSDLAKTAHYWYQKHGLSVHACEVSDTLLTNDSTAARNAVAEKPIQPPP